MPICSPLERRSRIASTRRNGSPRRRTAGCRIGVGELTGAPGQAGMRRLQFLVIALAVGGGYYLGALVGLHLRLNGATTSVLWPPNAILTAALLLPPPRRWLPLLLCVLPVHVLIQLPTGWPLPLIFTLFVTNCAEATIAAGGLWLLSDA